MKVMKRDYCEECHRERTIVDGYDFCQECLEDLMTSDIPVDRTPGEDWDVYDWNQHCTNAFLAALAIGAILGWSVRKAIR